MVNGNSKKFCNLGVAKPVEMHRNHRFFDRLQLFDRVVEKFCLFIDPIAELDKIDTDKISMKDLQALKKMVKTE